LLDTVFKLLNTVSRSHPFNTVRAAELQRWIEGGDYEAIRNDVYPRRGEDDRPLRRDYADAADYYGTQTRDAVRQVGDALSKTRDAVADFIRGNGNGNG